MLCTNRVHELSYSLMYSYTSAKVLITYVIWKLTHNQYYTFDIDVELVRNMLVIALSNVIVGTLVLHNS